jgi:hypothetical protein
MFRKMKPLTEYRLLIDEANLTWDRGQAVKALARMSDLDNLKP